MRQAAAEGVFDFRGFDVLAARHWRRLHLVLRGLVAANERQYARDCLAYVLARLAVPQTHEALQRDVERAIDILDDLRRSLWPWEESAQKKERKQTAKALMEAWEKEWGPMDAPETKKRVEETVRYLREKDLQARQKREQMKKARQEILQRMRKGPTKKHP